MPTILTLPDSPGPLSFPELAISNQQASPKERLGIESALSDVLEAEAEIDQVIQIAQAKKQEYVQRSRLLRLSLAPCRILPQEIWSHIFCVVMDLVDTSQAPQCKTRGEVGDGVPSWALGVGEREGVSIAYQLSLVCRMWRRAVLAAPYLWRCVPSKTVSLYSPGIDYADEEDLARYNYALKTHLSYSGSLPLKMCAILPTHAPSLPATSEYFRLLTKVLPRLSFLNMFVRGERAMNNFSTLPQSFENLKTLVLSILPEENSDRLTTQKGHPLTIFDYCPLLSELEVNFSPEVTPGIPLTSWIYMPCWSHLTRIKMTNVHAIDIFRILKVSVKLFDATFSVALRDEDQVDEEKEIVICPVLRALEMDLFEPQFHPSFKDWLQSPALTHLLLSLPAATQVHLTLPVRPQCLPNLTHLVLTRVDVLWNTRQWLELLALTPNVTHLKLSYFGGIGHVIRRLANDTLTTPGLKMLMIDEVTIRNPYYKDTADEDALFLGRHLSALTTARFQQVSSAGSVISNGMIGLKVAFSNEEYVSRMYASAFYRWNNWTDGSPSECSVYERLEGTLKPLVDTLRTNKQPNIASVSCSLSQLKFTNQITHSLLVSASRSAL